MSKLLSTKKVSTLNSNSSKISVRYDNVYLYQVPKTNSGGHSPQVELTRNHTAFRSVDNSSGPSTEHAEFTTSRNHNFVNGGIYNTTNKKTLLPAISLGSIERVKYNRNANDSIK